MSLLQDAPDAVRSLIKAPAFTTVVVLTLALSIGANAAIFSLTDQVLLRMLPVKAPEQLASSTVLARSGDGRSTTARSPIRSTGTSAITMPCSTG